MILVAFRSRVTDAIDRTDYAERAARMIELVEQAPGFQSLRTWQAPDGERLITAEFESMESIAAWREHPEHQAAQREGRRTYYQEYHLQVCEVIRESQFNRSERSDPSDQGDRGDAAA